MQYYVEKIFPPLSTCGIGFHTQESSDVAVMASAHIHAEVEFLFFLDGSFRVDVDDSQYNVNAGDLIICPSNSIHSVYHLNTTYGQYAVLSVSSALLLHIFKGEDSIKCILPLLKKDIYKNVHFRSYDLSDDICNVWKKILLEFEQDNPMMLSMLKAYAVELIVDIYRCFYSNTVIRGTDIVVDKETRKMIEKSIEYIKENYFRSLSPKECAYQLHVSYNTYARIFHLIVGKTFKEFLVSLRLEKAYNAIIATDLSITEIALSVGYNNSSYFAKEFKKNYGISPNDLRNWNMDIL